MIRMNKTFCLLAPMVGVALLCGCEKQAKINNAKIDLLSKSVVEFEQRQAKQTAELQAQLTALAETMNKTSDAYFEKSHEQAFFFHTNTLFLILTVNKNIESQLQVADTERAAQSTVLHDYYTNQLGTLFLCTAVIQEALTNQEGRIEEKVNTETRRVSEAQSEELLEQIKLAIPDADEIARRKQLAADVAQIKRDLAQLKAQLTPPAK